MTSKFEIEKVKQEIKVLEKKLALLEEMQNYKSPVEKAYKDWWGEYPSTEKSISETEDMRWAGFQAGFQAAYEEKVREDNYYDEVEKHKSQPRMEFDFGGKFEVVSYNGEVYYRLEFTDEVYWCKRKYDDVMVLVDITDGETHRLLEGVWFNDVKKGKYDEQEDNEWKSAALRFGEKLSDVGPRGYYNFTAAEWVEWALNAYKKNANELDCPDEPYRNVRAYWDEKDNPKPVDEVINRMVEERNSKKLWNIVRDKLGFSVDMCDEIVDAVEEWLPKEQSAAGSQNTFVECSIEGYNDCLKEMKEMLR